MHGWRGRIGLIIPSANTTNEPEFEQAVPDGVTVHTSRMMHDMASVENQKQMYDKSQRCAELLSTANVDVVSFGCTTGSLVSGEVEYALRMEDKLSEISGVPAVATAAAVLRALKALELDSVVIHTPYHDALNEREEAFIEDAGVQVRDINGLGLRPVTDKGDVHPEQVYRNARELNRSDADGIFISCTNYRTYEILRDLESDLDKPVVSSNQALLWNTLDTLSVDSDDIPIGRLFGEEVPTLELDEKSELEPRAD
jgi:maleate isomerase